MNKLDNWIDAALEQAVQAQAAEIAQLKAKLTAADEIDTKMAARVTELEVALQAKLDDAAKVPLTEEQLSAVMESVDFTYNPTKFARAIEAAHNIKGTTP